MTDLLAGRYELRARISKGGMGTVWRASDLRLRRDVAAVVPDVEGAVSWKVRVEQLG
jgi:serine/threonine protein kinase